jgi:hypothetical protein
MDVGVRVVGLEDAMKAMTDAFPNNPREQRGILNSAMRRSAAQTILLEAKQRALQGDGSGALSESLGIRNKSLRKIKTSRSVAGVEIAPIRTNRRAMAMYIDHYYSRAGRVAPAFMVLSGIRHGHLIEFGTVYSAARPFLWPAAEGQLSPYMQRVAAEMRKQIDNRLRRSRKHSFTGRLGR